MSADRLRLPGQYLLSQLGSGLRPFPYRGGVYRLLGLPLPAQERIGFRPPLPPVGFRYVQPQWGDLPPSLPSSGGTGPAPRAASSPANEFAAGTAQSPPARAEPPSVPGPRPATADFAQSLQRPSSPGPGGIHPGSGRPQNERAYLAPAIEAEAATPNPDPGEPKRKGVRGAVADTSAGTPLEPPPSGPRSTGLAIPGVTERRLGFTALAEQPSGQPSSQEVPAPLEPRGPRSTASAVAGAPRTAEAEPSATLRARPRVARQVDQLRQAAAQIAVRQASPREEPGEEPPSPRRAPSPSITREVIVIRPAPRTVRVIPRSFWASSVLRSTHLGVLR
jgi:hypothetical protein